MEAETFSLAAEIETDPTIGNPKQYPLVVGPQFHLYPIGETVLYDIVQRLLCDAIQAERD
jgi:hypothetical protein